MRPSILDQIAQKNSTSEFQKNPNSATNPTILDRIANQGLQQVDKSAPVELENLVPNADYSFREDNTIKDQDILQSELDASINSFRRGIDQTQISNYQGKLDAHQEIIDNNVDLQKRLIDAEKQGLIDKAKLNEELSKIEKQNTEAQNKIEEFTSDIEDNRVEMKDEFVSKLYQMKEAATQAKGGDAGLWESIKYTAPSTIGSSASLMGQQLAATFGTGFIKKLATNMASGAVGGPVGEGLAIAGTVGTTIGLLANSRYQETMAEIGGQLEQNQSKLLEQWQAANPGVEPDEEVLRQIRMQARKGKDDLFNQQMMLVIPDAIESLLMPGSKVLGAFKTGRALEQTIKGITDYNKYTRAAALGAKTYAGYLGEKFEEGYQYATEKRQTSEALGLKDYEDQGLIKNILTDSFDTLSSISYGPYGTLHGEGRYSDDKEFQFAEQSGGLLAILPGSIAASTKLYKDINTYRETNKELQNSGIANPEDKWFRLKDQIYAKHFDNNTMEYLLEGVRNLGEQTNDKGVPFLTKQEVASETQNIKDAFDKYLEVSKHIEDINPEGRFGLKLTPEQKVKIAALKNELFHTSMQLTRHQSKIAVVESLDNINNLISKQEELIDKINNTIDNSTIRKTYNIDTRSKLAESKLKDLKAKRESLLKDSGLTEQDLPKINSVEESNKNKQYLINNLNLSEVSQQYKDLLEVKDNRTLNEWFDKKIKQQEKLKADLDKTEEPTPEEGDDAFDQPTMFINDTDDELANRVAVLSADKNLDGQGEYQLEEAKRELAKREFAALKNGKAPQTSKVEDKTVEEQQEEIKEDHKRVEAERKAAIEDLRKRASKQKELEESFNSVKGLQELSENSRVKYKGKTGRISKHPEENVYLFTDDNTGKIYDIPQDSEFGYNGKLYDYGVFEIPDENPISDLIDLYETADGISIILDGKEYYNRYSNPMAAINRDEDGNIISVNLETKDGKKRTFKKYAEEIAYSLLLHTYNKLENEGIKSREDTKSRITTKATKADTERKESTPSGRDSEESKKIEEAIANLEKGIKESQKELNEQLDKVFKNAEALAKAKKERPTQTIREFLEGLDETKNNTEDLISDSLYDLQGKLAQRWNKSAAGKDNDQKAPEQRYFRFLEKNNIPEGTRLEVVTRKNNKSLFEKLFDKDAEAYEKEHKIETIYIMFVDKNNNPIYSNQEGQTIPKSIIPDSTNNLVYATLLTEVGIEGTGIKDKKAAKAELNSFREKLLSETKPVFLPVNGKSAGVRVREKTNNNKRKFNPVKGYITTDLKKDGLLELPTIVIGDKGATELKTGQVATARKLYAFTDDTNEGIDLIARNLTNDEAIVVTVLIAQRMGLTPKTVENVGEELDKLVYFGVPQDGPKDYTLGVKDGLLYIGTKSFTKEQLATEEVAAYLEDFLLNHKYVNASAKYMADPLHEFSEPVFNDQTGAIEYKQWNSYQEFLLSNEDGRIPLFGTDVPAIGKPKFRNYYVTYEPTVISNDIKIDESEIKPDLGSEESTDTGVVIDTKSKSDKKEFKKSGSNRKINLDRLQSILRDETKELSKDEIEWFKSQFPNISIESVKGLIDGNSFGRFLSTGQVLLSDLAPENTLRHEAFHVATQLYLTKKEISDIYKEVRERFKNKKLSDLEVEEILAEDFANYKDTGSVLGNRPLTRNIFQKLIDFIKKVVGLKPTEVRDIYNKLEAGQFKNKKIVGINQFKKLDKALPDKDEEYTKHVLDGIDYEFFEVLFENGFTPEKLFQVTNLTTKVYDIVRDSLIDRYDLARQDGDTKSIANFEYILENWDTKGGVLDLHNARVKSLGISLIKGENEKTGEIEPAAELTEDPNEITENSIVEEENKDTRGGDAYQAANTISTKDVMFKQTKLLIRTLPKIDSEGKVIFNKLGLPTLVDFNSTYNFLLKNLSGLSDYPSMIKRIEELSKNKPEFKILIERLGKPSDSLSFDQLMFQNQFRQDFDKNFATSYKTIIRGDGTIYLIDATRENTAGKIKELWRNKLPLLPGVSLNKAGRLVTTADYLKSKDNLEFLSKLGITFSTETLPALENNEEFSKAVLGIKQYIYGEKFDLTDLFNEKSTAKGNLATLYDFEAKYTPDITELSFISTEGKTVYSISLNNALSIIKNIINNAETKADLFKQLPHLDTVNTKNSLWLKTMFNGDGIRRKSVNINLDLLDGLATQDTSDKVQKQTTKLSKGDKLVQELNNLLLDGKTAYIRASDKATEHSLTLSNYGRGEKLAIPTKDLKDGFNSAKLKDTFRGYFKDEMQTMYELAINDLGKDVDIYRDIAEWGKDNKSIKLKWRLFSDFPNSEKVKSVVRDKLIELKSSDKTPQEKQAEFDALFDSLGTQIDDMTIKFFEKYTDELIKEYKSVGISGNIGISKELTAKFTYEQMMRSLAVNDFINSVEQIKLFVGDMGFYKDLFKRTSGATGTKKTARVDNNINTWLNTNAVRKDGKKADGKINVLVYQDANQKSDYFGDYVSALVDSGLTKEQAETILDAYASMDEGDAQGWITLDEYREFFIRTGDWKAEHQRIFEKSQSGEALSSDEIFYFMPIKAQYFGPQVTNNNLFAPAYHKYSLMPLIPQVVKGKNLEDLLKNMTANQVGYAVFKSGSKVGTKVDTKGKANRFYTEINHGEVNSENLLKQEIDYKFLGIQLDIQPKIKKEVIFGTQFRKLIFSNLFEGGTEKMPNAQKLFDEYTNIFKELIDEEKDKLVKELGLNPNENYKAENVQKLVDLLKEEAKGRNLADNIIDALQTEEINGKVMLKYNFDYMVNKAKIDSMVMSLVNSRLIRQMMNGDAMIQGASTGFEKSGRRVEGSNDLKFYRKDSGKTLAMEVKIPLTGEYASLLEQYKTIEGVNQALRDGKIDEKLITLIGYRIPTQGLNSIEFMKIQEFIAPESGNLIVLPTEIVAKSGGDYDIDKMNIFRPWFNAKTASEKKQNRIIEIAKEILEHEFNFNALITPNSTKILTDIVAELRFVEFKNENPDTKLTLEEYTRDYKNGLKNIRYTNQLKLTTKIDQFVKFLGGKAGVGIGALQNTHHILSQIANLHLNKSYYEDGEKKFVNIYFPHNKVLEGTKKDNTYKEIGIDLSKLKDVKGNNNISEVISQVINASVDIAKDPFMFDLNMNLETLSTYLYLVRTGVEFEQIAYFMKQPIITEFLEESSKNKSVFLKASGNAKKDAEIARDLTTQYENKIKELKKFKSQEEFDNYMADIKPRYDITTSELKGYLATKNQSSIAYYHAQIQLLSNYQQYKTQAGLLSEAINSVNHDTSGLGSNINASRNKIEQREKVRNTRFVNNIENIYNNTFVGAFNQHQFTIDAYAQFYNTQNDKRIVENNRYLLKNLTSKFTKPADINKLSTLIDNDLINWVVQNYGYESNIRGIVNNLFRGENSVAKRILKLKTGEGLTDEEKVLSENLLIKELYPLLKSKDHPTTDNLKIYSKRFDTFTSNQLTESFREIKNSNLQLAKDIMDLGILQSGLNNSAITFMGIIPFEYYGDLVKNAFVNFDKKNGAKDLYKFNQLFIRNNSKNSVIAKKATKLGLSGTTALGDGMYGKVYDTDSFREDLFTVRSKEEVKQKQPLEAYVEQEPSDYIPEVIENSELDIIDETKETNQKDYPEDLDNTEKSSTFVELDPKGFTNYSGAAIGGDKVWAEVGKEFGIGKQVDYRPEDLNRLTSIQKAEVENAYQKAVKDLGRGVLSANSFAGGLVRRDYLQAKAADSVFAISTILEPGQKDKKGYVNKTDHQVVEGGTGYAVQMAINLNKPVYVFDQLKNKWFKWENNSFVETETPTLTSKFAGIGTREINESGKMAIREVYKKTFDKPKTFDNRKSQPVKVKDTGLKGKLKESEYVTQHNGELYIKKNFYAQGIKFINEMKRLYPGQITVERAKTTLGASSQAIFKIKLTSQPELTFTTENETKAFEFTENDYNRMKGEIEDAVISDEDKAELLSELNKVDSKESLGELIKKICNL